MKLYQILLFIISLAISRNAYAQAPSYVPVSNLEAWYSLDSNAVDSSGNGNNGTVVGATPVADRFGNANSAYRFNGINNYIYIPPNSSLNITGSVSLVAWVKSTYAGTGQSQIVFRGDTRTALDPYFLMVSGSSVSFARFVGGGSTMNQVTFSKSIIDTSIFHLLVGTFNSSDDTMRIYYDGNQEQALYQPGSATYYTDSCHNMIGAVDYGAWQNFSGIIDDVGIWNRALTPCEIIALYTRNDHIAGTISGLASVCPGGIITLSDSVVGGRWSSGSITIATIGSSSGILTGVSAGTTTISYTIGGGCVVTQTVNIVSSLAPITGTNIVCAGQALTLSDVSTGGTWSSSNTSIASVGSSTGVVYSISSGIDTIIYTIASSGCFTNYTITVNPLPSTITGMFTVCAGSATILSSSSTGGAWTSTGSAYGTIAPTTGVFTGIATGRSIVTYTSPVGCFITATMNVNPAPSPIATTGSASMCVGNSIILTDPTTGGVWSGSTSYIIVGSAGSVTGIAAGTSIVTYSLSSGCYVTRQVTVNPSPGAITGLSSLCAGTTTTLFDAGGTWSSGTSSGILTIGSLSGIVTGVAAGAGIITYTLPTGCFITAGVTINPSPAPITGIATVCISDTTFLRDTSTGGMWTSSDYTIAYVAPDSGMVVGSYYGVAIISYSFPSGCLVTTTVTVNPAPEPISGLSVVCVGGTISLSSSTFGCTWSSSDVTKATVNPSTGLVTGVAAGVVTIYYTNASGCAVSQVVNVIAPVAPILGTLHVCQGSTTLLSDATTGGTWGCAPSTTATITSGGLASGHLAGVAAVSYTSSGCSTTVIVTVNPLPSTISGAGSVCIGSSITLTDVGGTWSTGSSSLSVGSTGVVTGVSTGSGLITYTLPTGCSTTKSITVNPLPGIIGGTSTVCVGQTITLTDGGGGLWSKSNANVNIGSSSGVVNGVTAGPSIITYTLVGTGCYTTKTVTVSTSAGVISGIPYVCVGATTNLSDAGAGRWSIVPLTTATIGTTTGLVTGVSPGPAVVTYSIGTGCMATATISVNPLPAAITGTGGICPGGSITLSGPTGGTWSCSGAAISGAGVVTGTIAGTPTITYTLPTGCTRTATITINPTPAIPGGPSALCVGAHITLTESGGGTWLSGSTAVATITPTTGVVTGVTTGTSNITFTSTVGCSISTTVTVSLSPTTITGPGTVCAGASVTLSDTAGGGLWSAGTGTGAVSVGSLSGIVTGVSAGTTSITYSLGTGCTVTRTETVTASPAAIHGTTTLCAGTSTTLTETTTGGTWSSTPTTTATITGGGTLSGIAAGTAIIDYTAGGCFASDTITVNTAPTTIGGPATVCQGSAITATDAVTGGLWSTTSGNIAIDGTTGSITGITAGTAGITYAIGTCTVNRTITVNPISTITGATGVCVGNTTTLSDATTGGVWTITPTTTATITSTTGVVNGLSAGAANVTYTLTTGCKATYTVSVSTSPSVIGGLLHVCIGSATNLSNTAGGGLWSTTSSNITIGSSSGIVTGVAAGTAPVLYSLGTGCTAATTVTVNLPPAGITGRLDVCPGATTTLADATTGGTWSSGSARTSVDSRGVVTGISAGAAIISYLPPTGCVTTTTVNVNPLPAIITGAATVCESLTATLSDASPGGSWTTTSTTATIGGSTGIVTGGTTGTAIITYTLPTGCSITASIYVNAAPAAITGTTAMCLGSGTALSDASTGGTWSTPDGAGIITVGTATGAVTGIGLGTATVSYTTGGCASQTTVHVNSLPDPIAGNSHLCVGITDTLTDAGGGIWTSSNPSVAAIGSATGIVTSVIPGPVTITYSLGVGCAVTKPVTVTPSPASITGLDNICMGATTILSDATTGGAWSSGDVTIATISSGGSVHGLTGGTTIIKYTIAATGCYARYPVGVIQVPAITGVHNICAWGDTMTVADALPGASWTSTLVTVSDSAFVLAYAPGTATITYTESHGCFATATLTVNPLPAEITGNLRVCAGLTTTLADATTGGVWTSGTTTVATVPPTAGTVTGVTTGSSVITYTLPVTGCKQLFTVTVQTPPSPVSGTASMCVSAATVLGDTASGGIWSSGSTTIATVGATTGTVNGIAAGTAMITYTMGASCQAMRQVTVNTLPTVYAVSGGGNYCSSASGVHVGLTGSGTGIGYQLYNGSTATGTLITGTGAALDFGVLTVAGVYTVTATNSATGCGSNMSGSATITIIPSVTPGINITATPGTTLCTGATIHLASTAINGGATPGYQWSVNGSTIPGATSSTYNYTPANGDVITATLNSDAVCASPASVVSNTVTMTVNPELIPVTMIIQSPTGPVLVGETITFTATVTNGGATPTYQWLLNGAAIPSATNATYAASNLSNADTVTCVVTSSGPCGGNSSPSNGIEVIVVSNAGVTSPGRSKGDVTLVPNPSRGSFIIEGALGTTDEEVQIIVTDVLGQQMYVNTTKTRNGILHEQVQLGNTIANGMYLVSVHSASGSYVFHLVVEQ